MKKTKKNELNDLLMNKIFLSKNIHLNKNKKYSIVSTLDTQNSHKNKEKSKIMCYSTKELNINKNNINKSNENNNQKKEILSFKGSSFPIFLSSMTNSKNKLNFINHKFNNNSLGNNSISNYSILNNNSNIYNQKYEENGKSTSIPTRKNHKKLDLKINFPQIKKMTNIKIISSRNRKQNNYNKSEDKYINLSNKSSNMDISTKCNNGSISSFNKNGKIQNYSMDNDMEKYFQLNQKVKEINDFVNKNKIKRKISNIIYKKINEKINSTKKIESKSNINENKYEKNSNIKIDEPIKMKPNFIKNKNFSCGDIYSKSNKNLINMPNNKIVVSLKHDINNPISNKINIIHERPKREKKTKILKKIELKKYTIRKKLKKKLKEKIKFFNLISNNDIIKNEKDKKFINKVINYNDSKEKEKQIKKNIKGYKKNILVKQKYNLDKFILKNSGNLKSFNFKEEEQYIKENKFKGIYKNKIKKYINIYNKINTKSILYILFFSYIYYFNKCGLDMNLLNYLTTHVEFSSIYLPIVKFRGQKEQMIITRKLFSYKETKTIFHEEKSKFIEHIKNKKKFQFLTINYITKELINENISSEYDKCLEPLQPKQKLHISPIKSLQNKIYRRKGGYFRANSMIAYDKYKNLTQKQHSSRKTLEVENPSKPLTILNQKQFFKFSNKRMMKFNIKNSLMNNLLFYKLSGKENKEEMNESKYYIQKIISIIHENKTNKKITCTYENYLYLLRRIKGKENMETILRTLIKEGEILLFNEYLNKNARNIDINAKDEDGNSFLILSLRQGVISIIKTLLERGIDVNIQNNEGNTALHYALSGKNFIIADALKKFGAKEDLVNKYGMSPWDSVGKSIENN